MTGIRPQQARSTASCTMSHTGPSNTTGVVESFQWRTTKSRGNWRRGDTTAGYVRAISTDSVLRNPAQSLLMRYASPSRFSGSRLPDSTGCHHGISLNRVQATRPKQNSTNSLGSPFSITKSRGVAVLFSTTSLMSSHTVP